jgi:hypothetical protein
MTLSPDCRRLDYTDQTARYRRHNRFGDYASHRPEKERNSHVSTPPAPGDRGYGAYWKRQLRKAGLVKLGGLEENVSGRALLAVLAAFGDHIDNRSGEAWPSQAALAEESGQGKRTVERAMKAAQRLGLVVKVAPGIPHIRGTTYRATVPPQPPGGGGFPGRDGRH